jgi:ABC-2 type transport system permease protein
VEFGDNSYKVYEKEETEVQGKILEGMLSVTYNSMLLYGYDSQPVNISVNKADFMPPVDSTDYYGIIYIIYFAWCAVVCASGLLSSEKKYGIDNRFRISGVSEFKLYLAKFLSVGIVVLGGITISAVSSALILGVHWGNILLSALIVLVLVMASTAFGLMFYSITNSLVITIIIVFMIVWIWGFWGGSFEVYMFSSTNEVLKAISPIYHENRALIELLAMGKSDYLLSGILYPLTLAIGCSGVSVIANQIRRRGRK